MRTGDRSGTGSVHDEQFWPLAVLLNFDLAEQAADHPSEHGTGIYEVRYTDTASLRGDYILYLQVHRIR